MLGRVAELRLKPQSDRRVGLPEFVCFVGETNRHEVLEEVVELLEDAARRADANDRKTVQPRDL
jgi:hypothetical protein